MHTRDRCYRLLAILQDIAPDQKAQVLCSQMYHKAFGEGASPEEIQKMMVNVLADGVNNGNWPWNEVQFN